METINNNTDRDLSSLQNILTSFLPYAKERLGYDKPCCVNFVSDVENSKMDFGKTAYYDPSNMEIVIYVDGRHPKDMLRSISHELVHHTQNCRGDFDFQFETNPGYAQNNQKLRELEAEAYLLGNGFLVRDFEDSIKLGDQVLMEWKNKKKKLLKEQEDLAKLSQKNLETTTSKEQEDKLASVQSLLAQIFDKGEDKLAQKIVDKNLTLAQKQQLFQKLVDMFGLNDYVAKRPSDVIKRSKQKVGLEETKEKPDFLDLDKDGDKKESMKKAAEDKKKEDSEEKENVKEHYITRSEIVGNELMKRWFSKK
jgi:hypothetical protein